MTAAPVSPGPGGPLAYAGTAILAAVFYALTAHIAARFVIGSAADAPRAGIVGVGLAVVSLVLGSLGAGVVVAATVAADVALVRVAYREPWRRTGGIVAVHVAVSVILAGALLNIVRSIAGAG